MENVNIYLTIFTGLVTLASLYMIKCMIARVNASKKTDLFLKFDIHLDHAVSYILYCTSFKKPAKNDLERYIMVEDGHSFLYTQCPDIIRELKLTEKQIDQMLTAKLAAENMLYQNNPSPE